MSTSTGLDLGGRSFRRGIRSPKSQAEKVQRALPKRNREISSLIQWGKVENKSTIQNAISYSTFSYRTRYLEH